MGYSKSLPLIRWAGQRRTAIETLAQAHAAMGEVDGPGRPRELGRPVGHAYVLRVVAEFQAYARDLHDLAAEGHCDLGPGATAWFGPDRARVGSGRVGSYRGDIRKGTVVNDMAKCVHVGAKVRVPWGLDGPLDGEIIEVWGDPPVHVRVQLVLDGEDSDPVVILLSPKDLEAA